MRYGIDWATETDTVYLDETDKTQYIKLKRLSSGQKRERQSLAARLSSSGDPDNSNIEFQLAINRVRDFEYETMITDFCLKDENGEINVYKKDDPAFNKSVYDHFTEELMELLDERISALNKEGKEKETEDIAGKSKNAS